MTAVSRNSGANIAQIGNQRGDRVRLPFDTPQRDSRALVLFLLDGNLLGTESPKMPVSG